MPIKVDIKDNNSSVKVRTEDNNPEVKAKSDWRFEKNRLESLIKELQITKQNLGFICLDAYVNLHETERIEGTIPDNVLNLLTSLLINKVTFRGNGYYLTRLNLNSFTYFCSRQSVNPNSVTLNTLTGYFEFSNQKLSHDDLDKLDYLNSGHTGFAGIEFGTVEHWESLPDYTPVAGMIVVYTDKTTYIDEEAGEIVDVPAIKIGDGNAKLADLKFIGTDVLLALEAHTSDTVIHVTQEDRNRWDNKLNYKISVDQSVDADDPNRFILEFTRD